MYYSTSTFCRVLFSPSQARWTLSVSDNSCSELGRRTAVIIYFKLLTWGCYLDLYTFLLYCIKFTVVIRLYSRDSKLDKTKSCRDNILFVQIYKIKIDKDDSTTHITTTGKCLAITISSESLLQLFLIFKHFCPSLSAVWSKGKLDRLHLLLSPQTFCTLELKGSQKG